jgi:hypothetical protein
MLARLLAGLSCLLLASGDSAGDSIAQHKQLYSQMQEHVHKRMKEHQGELEARYMQRIHELEQQLLAAKEGCDCESKQLGEAEDIKAAKAAAKVARKVKKEAVADKKNAAKSITSNAAAEPANAAAPQVKSYTFLDKPLGISLSLKKTNTGRNAIVVKKVKRVGTPIEVGDELLFLDAQDVKAWKLNDVMKELKKGKMPITMKFGPAPDAFDAVEAA